MISVVIIKSTRETASFRPAFQLSNFGEKNRDYRGSNYRENAALARLVKKGGNKKRREKGAKFETSVERRDREYPAKCRPRRFSNYQCNTRATSNYVVPLNGKPLTRDKSRPRRLRNHANSAMLSR